MEINLTEEDAKIEIIKGNKALCYKVKNNGKNINNVPIYIQWLNLMKTEKGENGIIFYCTRCYTFFYVMDLYERNLMFHDNCNVSDFAEFCEYCGELYNEDSICCLRQCFDMFNRHCYTTFFESCSIYILFLPIIAFMWAFFVIFFIIKTKRNKKYDDINYIDEKKFESLETIPAYILLILINFVYSLTFLVPYFLTIYIFQLVLMIKINRQKVKDEANDFRRY